MADMTDLVMSLFLVGIYALPLLAVSLCIAVTCLLVSMNRKLKESLALQREIRDALCAEKHSAL